MGPLNQWPRGHLILALGSGPSVEPRVYRSSTSAGSPHRTAPWPRNAGHSTSIAWPSMIGIWSLPGAKVLSPRSIPGLAAHRIAGSCGFVPAERPGRHGRMLLSGQAPPDGVSGGFSAIGHPEFGEDAADMVQDRIGADEQPLGDRAVRVAGGDQAQHLDLAAG